MIKLYPGDQCVLLRAQLLHDAWTDHKPSFDEPSNTQDCLLIGSPIRQALGLSAERLVWVDVDDRERGGATVAYVGTTNATDMLLWKDGADAKPHDCYNFGPARNTGYLNDGSRYVVYRFVLYMDGFKEKNSKRDTREVAGSYMLPLGLKFENRRGSVSPRILKLGYSSVSHNGVLKLLLGDIRRRATTGLDGVDPYGHTFRIFWTPSLSW